ncbi:MAG: hypothetical protein GXP54_06330 [Deltaproteobacteria bacterium]|nr:hypothetical protein [Deltaproteobacteria bacterium]
MKKILFIFLFLSALCPVMTTACSGVDAGPDGFADQGVRIDVFQDNPGVAADPSTFDAGILDPGAPEVVYYELPPFDAGDYLGVPKDYGLFDQGSSDPGYFDHGGSDSGQDSGGTSLETPCRSFTDCGLDETCNFALERCEGRSTWKEAEQGLYAFHPRAGAVGDRIVIDGARFFSTLLGGLSVKASIGGKSVISNWASSMDENRILADVPSGASGQVKIGFEGGAWMTFPMEFGTAPTGVIACDGTTPGTGPPGIEPGSMGPYAAGYLDIELHKTRIFYPAKCGSIRRPAEPGTWPVVGLLHGNGALHINLEYLGQALASWGFVSFMPQSEALNEYSQDVVDKLIEVVNLVWNRDLSTIHPALAGVSTTSDIAFAGHSRGCARMQHILDWDADLKAHTRGVVFIGPADDGVVVPGMFMVFGAGKDGQSFEFATNDAYARQSAPKWKIFMPGGNHGSFCDHKIYWMFDGQPTIKRHDQLQTVLSFALPFLQRAFGLFEPFADQLDTPPSSSIYQVEYQLK